MTDDHTIQPTPKRFRLPSVWVLVVATLLLAIATLFMTVVLPYQRQMAAIERIEALGASITSEPVGPDWLRNLLGDERMKGFDNVTEVFVGTTDDICALVQQLPVFSHLKSFTLFSGDIPDCASQHLLRISTLESLTLFNGQLSDSVRRQMTVQLPKCTIEELQFTNGGQMEFIGPLDKVFLPLDDNHAPFK